VEKAVDLVLERIWILTLAETLHLNLSRDGLPLLPHLVACRHVWIDIDDGPEKLVQVLATEVRIWLALTVDSSIGCSAADIVPTRDGLMLAFTGGKGFEGGCGGDPGARDRAGEGLGGRVLWNRAGVISSMVVGKWSCCLLPV
jgi:hypothetical protein